MNPQSHGRRSAFRVVALSLLVIAGCSTARRSEPIAGAMPLNDESVAHGRRIFMAQCQQCHPGGEGGLGPSINDKPLPRFYIKFQVRHGLGAMPSIDERRVDDRDLEALMDYIVSLRRHK